MDASIHVSLFHRQIVAVSGGRALVGTRHRGGALHSTVTCLESAKRLKKAHIRFGIALGMPQLGAAWSNVNSFGRALLMLTQEN